MLWKIKGLKISQAQWVAFCFICIQRPSNKILIKRTTLLKDVLRKAKE